MEYKYCSNERACVKFNIKDFIKKINECDKNYVNELNELLSPPYYVETRSLAEENIWDYIEENVYMQYPYQMISCLIKFCYYSRDSRDIVYRLYFKYLKSLPQIRVIVKKCKLLPYLLLGLTDFPLLNYMVPVLINETKKLDSHWKMICVSKIAEASDRNGSKNPVLNYCENNLFNENEPFSIETLTAKIKLIGYFEAVEESNFLIALLCSNLNEIISIVCWAINRLMKSDEAINVFIQNGIIEPLIGLMTHGLYYQKKECIVILSKILLCNNGLEDTQYKRIHELITDSISIIEDSSISQIIETSLCL